MRILKSGVFIVFVFTALCAGAPCLAQSSSSAEAEARKQFEAGKELFEAGQFEQASVAFARAYELRPSYKILYLVGKCEDAQRHFALSLDAFTRYLSEARDQIEQARKDEVKKEIERLNALVGSIVVASPVDGATVFVDDERRGETPLATPVFVDLGKHTVVVKKGAEELHREVVKIAGGQRIDVKVEVAGTAVAAPGTPAAAAPEAPQTAQPEQPADGGTRRPPVLLIGGIASLAVGVGAGVVGGVFAAKRGEAIDDMDATQTGPLDDYNDAKDRESTANAVMIAGFVGAGVFVAAGAVLVVLHVRSKKKTDGAAVSLRPSAGGLAVVF
jgi:hypothetical protein